MENQNTINAIHALGYILSNLDKGKDRDEVISKLLELIKTL